MDGRNMLERVPQEIKDVLINSFGSIDNFYAFVIQLNKEQYVVFKKTQQFDDSKIDALKSFLERKGLDFMVADDLVNEIGNDYSEVIAANYVQSLLGPSWKEKIEAFEKMI